MDEKYDSISHNELKKRLKREPTLNEIVNSDNDADLAIETLWQLVKDLDSRLSKLEVKQK